MIDYLTKGRSFTLSNPSSEGSTKLIFVAFEKLTGKGHGGSIADSRDQTQNERGDLKVFKIQVYCFLFMLKEKDGLTHRFGRLNPMLPLHRFTPSRIFSPRDITMAQCCKRRLVATRSDQVLTTERELERASAIMCRSAFTRLLIYYINGESECASEHFRSYGQ